MINRLYPAKNSGRYHILSQLRTALEQIIVSSQIVHNEAKLFDYGCGSKPYEPLWENHIKQYIGADFEGNELADVTILQNGEIEDIDKLENNFDIVFSSQVLEHVRYVPAYLNNAAKLLKKDGNLVLSTHGVWMYHPHPSDFWRWTKEGLIEEIQKSNEFRIESVTSVMGMTATGLQLFQDGLIKRVPAILRKLFFRFIQVLQSWFDDYDKDSNNASVFIVVAKKIS